MEHKIDEIFKHVYYHQSLIKYNKNTRGTQNTWDIQTRLSSLIIPEIQ